MPSKPIQQETRIETNWDFVLLSVVSTSKPIQQETRIETQPNSETDIIGLIFKTNPTRN